MTSYDTDFFSQNALMFGNNFGSNMLSNVNNDKFEEALANLTTESYSPIYGVINNIQSVVETTQGPNNYIPTGNESAERSGLQELSAWDPRLARVDSFLAVKDSNGANPLIVPFASTTAAGAFYDMVFTTEVLTDTILRQKDSVNSVNDAETRADNIDYTKDYTNSENLQHADMVKMSEKVYMGSKDQISAIKGSSDSYGIASIVNPYTLTKLCGGLTTNGQDDSLQVENHLYDVRDKRRFYDRSVEVDDDVLSISNPTTTNIITYSNRDPWGRTPYYFQDFVFCKYWNIIPNNRLITLRKYHAPVYDNLQFSNMYKGSGDTVNDQAVFAPIATVLSYFGDETNNSISSLLSFSTGTNWKDIKADIHNVTGDTGSNPRSVIDDMFNNGGGFPTGESKIMQSIIGKTNFITGKYFSYGKFVGLLSPGGYNIEKDQDYFDKMSQANVDPSDQLYANKIKGPVNRVDSTKARAEGITYDQKLSITCEYIARPIGGVNTKAAMLDILSNCLEIGSVEAMFWGGGYRFNIHPQMYPFKNTAFKNRIMDDLYAGRIFGKDGALAHTVEGLRKLGTSDSGEFNWDNVINNLKSVFGQTLGAIGGLINNIGNTLFGDAFNLFNDITEKAGQALENGGNAVSEGKGTEGANKATSMLSNLTKNLNSMWRAQVIKQSMMPNIEGMRALLTGEPVGNWHLMVGNPLNPMLVIGNLVCTSMKIEWGEELSPDDFPTELKVVYELDHGMARDKAAIQSMFNRGNGKIYELPDYIRASSDYETKVDNYTGPATNGSKGWYMPKYMNNMKMLRQSGFSGGWQTYKMPNPTKLAMNAHTDNMFIAKFTPVDVDAAISNVRTGTTTFFGANSGSRAWIRGAAVTRKLMN